MNDLQRRLAGVTPSDAAAEDRAWELAHAAFVRRAAPPRRHAVRSWPVAVVAAAGLLVLVAAMTSAGSTVIDLVADRGAPPSHRAPHHAATPRPAVQTRAGTVLTLHGGWASVRRDRGRPRRLARADEATLSAFGRYVAVAHRRRLSVYALDGRWIWSVDERHRIHAVRWSPDGLRIAYRTGAVVRLVDGNGERARTLGRATGGAMAWRPGPEAVLTYLRTWHVAASTDVATGADVARVRPPAGTTTLAWSRDGHRLVAAGAHELRLFDRRGRLLRSAHPPAGRVFARATFAPHGHRLRLTTRARA